MTRTIKVWMVLMLMLAIFCGGIGYVAGERIGFSAGVAETTHQYDFWATSIMYADPDIQLQSMLFIPDGGKIPKPHCEPPSAGYLRLARRPDAYNRTPEIEDAPSIDAWIAHIPTEAGQPKPYAAAVVGCARGAKATDSN